MSSTSASAGRRRAPSRLTSACVGLNGAPGNGPKPVMSTVDIFAGTSSTTLDSLASSTTASMRPPLDSQRLGYLFGRQRRREAAFGDRGFQRRQARLDGRVRLEAPDQPFLDHRPHPFDLLLAPLAFERARLRQPRAMVKHLVP